MGILRRPRKFNLPPEVPEREESEEEEEDSDEGSEPGTPPPAPPTPPELRALRVQAEQVERDLQGYGVSGDRMKEIAENMREQVERMEKELIRIKTKMAEDGMPCAAQGYTPGVASSRMAAFAGAGSVPAAGPVPMVNSMGDGILSLPRIGNDGANKNGNYTPIAEIAREVQKVAEEIEAATGISLATTSSAEEEVEVTEEPAIKKEKMEDDQNRDHPPSTN